MGGLFGVASAPTVCLICFSVRTIIRIWEPAEAVWRFMGRKALTGRFIILRIPHFEPNLKKNRWKCMGIWESAAFRIMSHSH